MSSQSRATTTTIVAAAAAMVTMAGTVWLMTPTSKYEDESSSEEFDVYGRRKPKSSLLKGVKSSRRRRRQRNRRVHWPDQHQSESTELGSPSSSSSLSASTPSQPAVLEFSTPSSSYSSVQSGVQSAQDGSASVSESASPSTPSTPSVSPSDSKENQSNLVGEGNHTTKSPNNNNNDKSSPMPSSSSILSWSSPSSPLAKISQIPASAANAILNSANGVVRKRQMDPTKNGDSNGYNSSSEPKSNAIPYMRFIQYLKPLRRDAWSEPEVKSFMVRGPTYMKDRKKINNSAKPAFSLLTVDLIQHVGQEPYYQPICGHPRERVQQAIKREEEFGSADKELPPFVFAVNLCLPSSGVVTNANLYYHQVSYFGIENMDEIENETTPFGRLMNKFIFGDDDDFRDKTFKLIPRVVKGNLIVRRAVGSKPAIIGRKVKQHYFRGDRYFEILIDIGSDSIADRIVRLALGYAKSLVTDMCFVLEGTSDMETLPERIFGGVTLKYIDFKAKDGDRRMLPLDYTTS
mmetsp:Transcript_39863/g.96198  ORF Transcript_39863/g.96198 Transcript_39863/m.96198 type:complete len:518 (-) Transcript_39863:1292-2845(-)